MDIFKFLRQWVAIMVIVMITMAIIGFSMSIIFKKKTMMPTEEIVERVAEDAIIDAVEIALTYSDGQYIVDRQPKRWQIDIT